MVKSVKAICIDDKNKPKEIPAEKWVKIGETYNINHIYIMVNQDNIKGCELEEFDITMYKPYNCYRLSRFAVRIEDLDDLLALTLQCNELNDVDISSIEELLKENIEILEEV